MTSCNNLWKFCHHFTHGKLISSKSDIYYAFKILVVFTFDKKYKSYAYRLKIINRKQLFEIQRLSFLNHFSFKNNRMYIH